MDKTKLAVRVKYRPLQANPEETILKETDVSWRSWWGGGGGAINMMQKDCKKFSNNK